MALGDAYASAAEYRTRVTKTSAADDTVIDEQLKAVSHYIDSRTRRRDGFNQSAAVEARIYDIQCRPGRDAAFSTDWGRRLYLPDGIATLTGLIVKVDLNGDYDVADADETLTINTHFWAGPANAATGSDPRPFEFLDINPNNSVVSSWPEQRRALEITAKFGWPEIPEAIKELTVMITRQVRDLQESGYTAAVQSLDQVVAESRELSLLMMNIERQYSLPPGF